MTIAEVQRTHDLDLGVSGNASARPERQGRGRRDARPRRRSASARDFILQLVGGYGTIKYNVAIAALRGARRRQGAVIAGDHRAEQPAGGAERRLVASVRAGVADRAERSDRAACRRCSTSTSATVLTITPTINPDGYVNLQVQQQDNSATNEVQFDAPVINKREATTQVFIRDGQTTVIGGLADTPSRTTSPAFRS